jgi:hypothetical protein
VIGGGSGRKFQDVLGLNSRLDHGGSWRTETEWPLARARNSPFYLHAGGVLSVRKPEVRAASTSWRFDPCDPVPTVGGNISVGFEFMPAGGFDQRTSAGSFASIDALPLSARHDVCVFSSEPLAQDLEVTGAIIAHLWISSSALDTDFTAKLIDLYPPSADYTDGFALNLSNSIIRARVRNSFEGPELMMPGEVYKINFPLYATSKLFKAGHRIRVDISSSNFPRFDVNPNTGAPLGEPGPMVVAENTVYHDAEHPSHVVLPVIEG